MTVSRRTFLIGAGAAATALSSTQVNAASRAKIDARVRGATSEMTAAYPFTRSLMEQAAGVLMMPRITKGGFFVGGAYGEGALMIKGAPVDYYSIAAGSYGLQLGVQSFSNALFLMTPASLKEFRQRDGWTLGVDLEAAVLEQGEAASIDTNTRKDEIYAITFGQQGLMLGASVEGAKYSRIVR
ncbi:MAG: lipid-binding SYLF domain-containing protein [Pseudomonadota bacterium]